MADSLLFLVNNILAGFWLNCISSVEITLFALADILLQHRALLQCKGFVKCKLIHSLFIQWLVKIMGPSLFPFIIIPPLHRRWKWGILDSPWCLSVRPSVRPSVGKVSATFHENYWLNSFHPWDFYLWGKSLDPYWFLCSCPHFWPSGGQKLTANRGFRNFSRKLSARFISSLGFILMG